jgi:hypothetical protein
VTWYPDRNLNKGSAEFLELESFYSQQIIAGMYTAVNKLSKNHQSRD